MSGAILESRSNASCAVALIEAHMVFFLHADPRPVLHLLFIELNKATAEWQPDPATFGAAFGCPLARFSCHFSHQLHPSRT